MAQPQFVDTSKIYSPTAAFAFEPPSDDRVAGLPSKHLSSSYPTTNSSGGLYAMSNSYSSGLSQQSAVDGSVMSVDSTALPRISRDFAPPTLHETRRPATAAGALQGLAPADYTSEAKKRDNSDGLTKNGFQNPFSANPTEGPAGQTSSVDPHFVPGSNDHATSWHSSAHPSHQQGAPYASAPANVTNFPYVSVPPNVSMGRQTQSMARPQTSDGLPSYAGHMGNVSLPPARSLVGQMGYPSNGSLPAGYPGSASTSFVQMRDGSGQILGGYPAAPRYGSFDQADTRYMGIGLATASQSGDSNELQFVSLAGPAPKKRSRRRYDEIERIYPCEWKGCDKAYGTLNHLNAHVAMQKHGEKRLPSQFKEMRKEWRKKKREEASRAAAEAASKEYSQHATASASGEPGGPMGHAHGPGIDYSQGWMRDSGGVYPASAQAYGGGVGMEASEIFGHRGSAGSFLTNAPTWSGSDTRPTTANTVSSAGSPTDGRFAYSAPWPASTGAINMQYAGGYHKAELVAPPSRDGDYSPGQDSGMRVGFNPYTMTSNLHM